MGELSTDGVANLEHRFRFGVSLWSASFHDLPFTLGEP
jgi:hypothetical protein